MENVIPKYQRPITDIGDPVNSVKHWDEAIDAFDEKKYKKAVLDVINYMNADLLKDKDTSGTVEIVQMQGSAEIRVTVSDSHFSVKVPFLKITEQTNQVALLRRVAEVNFTPLKLPQIHLRNNELWFEYEMPISLSQPNKVYDILRSVIIYADQYDDLFIEKYNASFYKTPETKPLTAEEQDTVWNQINAIFEDYKNYLQFFTDKRWDDWVWDLLVISFLKISNMTYVHGKLRSDLIKYISILFDGDIDYNHRMDKGKNYMNTLLEKSRAEIMKNVYHAEQFVSLRWRSNPEIISDRLKNNLDRVKDYEKDGSNFNLSYYLQFVLLKLIYDYNLDEKYKNEIETVLETVSGLDPTEAVPKLAKVFHALQSGSINEQVEVKKKGFFSKLFN